MLKPQKKLKILTFSKFQIIQILTEKIFLKNQIVTENKLKKTEKLIN